METTEESHSSPMLARFFARAMLNRLITVACSRTESSRGTMWLQARPKHSGYDFCHETATRKVHQTKHATLLCFHRLVESIQHHQQESSMDSPRANWMPTEICKDPSDVHDGMIAQVLNSGDVTEPFEISNGMKQGYILAPILFNIFTCMVAHAVQDLGSEVYNQYRLDGSLSDLHRLTAKTKSLFDLIQEALFADDCALVTHEDSDLQLMLDCFSSSAKLFGLTISLEKTEVLHQPAPGSSNTAPAITTDSTQLANTESFKYLGSVISQDGTLDREADARIGKASQVL